MPGGVYQARLRAYAGGQRCADEDESCLGTLAASEGITLPREALHRAGGRAVRCAERLERAGIQPGPRIGLPYLLIDIIHLMATKMARLLLGLRYPRAVAAHAFRPNP